MAKFSTDKKKFTAVVTDLFSSMLCLETAVIEAANQGNKIGSGIVSVSNPISIGLSEFSLEIHLVPKKPETSAITVDIFPL